MLHLLQAATTYPHISIIVAIIGACALLGGVVLKWYLETKIKVASEDNRLNSLVATFYGKIIQIDCEYFCELTISTAKRNKIEGLMTLFYSEYLHYPATSQTMEVSGIFSPDDLLALTYKNVKKSNKQTGVLFLQYLPDGETIIGEFMGFGPITRDFEKCKGKLSLTRQHNK